MYKLVRLSSKPQEKTHKSWYGVSYGSIADYRKAKAMRQAAANSSKGGGE